MHIYDGVTFSGEKQVVYGDVVDTGGRTFKTGVSIRVLTGWYEILECNARFFRCMYTVVTFLV